MQRDAHAFLCQGTAASMSLARSALSARGIDASDRYERSYDSLGIDEARELRDKAPLGGRGTPRLFIIAANTLTNEAQNALLKTLEEPGAGAIFCIIVPAPDTLLPTLRSRVEHLELDAGSVPSSIDIDTFLSAAAADRIEMLKQLTTAEEKDTAGTLSFLAGLERAVRGRPDSAFGAIYTARSCILDKGALRKPLLEGLALTLPRVG